MLLPLPAYHMNVSSDSVDPNLFQSAKPIQFVFLIALVVHKDPLECTGGRDAGSEPQPTHRATCCPGGQTFSHFVMGLFTPQGAVSQLALSGLRALCQERGAFVPSAQRSPCHRVMSGCDDNLQSQGEGCHLLSHQSCH